ncbi:FliM/FliN family flagellar motor switch protein [Mesorhizobium sp. NPDC059025]|uniref:FliM/FliN family flagellar motor switch protein n=1 Tax=unclassified Mesorhizobium TaxID=325217 RepID=UPI0036948966
MSGLATMDDSRALVIERLVGDSGEASHVIGAGRSMGERIVSPLQKRLSGEIGAQVTIDLRAVEVSRTTQARSHAGDNFAMTVAPSTVSSDALTMVMDAQAVAVMVSALFGGDPEAAISPIERDLSPLEAEVATLVFEEIAQALNGSGKRSLDLRFPVPRAMSGQEARRRVLRDGAAVRLVFGLSTLTESGTITVMIPQRVLLVQRNGGTEEETSSQTEWHERFSEEVMRSAVTLEATMPLARMTLGDLARLRVGQVLDIEENAQGQAQLSARNKTLFVCEFGKLGQNYTVRIKQPFDAGQDFIDGLMPG